MILNNWIDSYNVIIIIYISHFPEISNNFYLYHQYCNVSKRGYEMNYDANNCLSIDFNQFLELERSVDVIAAVVDCVCADV